MPQIRVHIADLSYLVTGEYYCATPNDPADFSIESVALIRKDGTPHPFPYGYLEWLEADADGAKLMRALEGAAVKECERRLREDGEL